MADETLPDLSLDLDDDYNPAEVARQRLEAQRLEAIRLLQAGRTPVEVAERLSVHPSSVRKWRDLHALGGFPALAVRKPPGQPRGISFLRRR